MADFLEFGLYVLLLLAVILITAVILLESIPDLSFSVRLNGRKRVINTQNQTNTRL